MKMKVLFTEQNMSFTPQFGVIHNISDGGFERGYEQGYIKGSSDGYIAGEKAGYDTGYHEGNKETFAVFKNIFNGTAVEISPEDMEGITRIPPSFWSNNNILQSFVMPDSIISIGGSAFYWASITHCVLSNNIKTMSTHAFSRCYNLNWGDLILPEALEYLDEYAFWYNRGIKSIVLPASISYLGKEVFAHCTNLEWVACRAVTPPSAESRLFYDTKLSALFVPRDSLDEYKNATNWSLYGDYMLPLEDYTVDGTITGAIDPDRI